MHAITETNSGGRSTSLAAWVASEEPQIRKQLIDNRKPLLFGKDGSLKRV